MNEELFEIHVSYQTVTKKKLAKYRDCIWPIFSFLIYQFVMAIIFLLDPRINGFFVSTLWTFVFLILWITERNDQKKPHFGKEHKGNLYPDSHESLQCRGWWVGTRKTQIVLLLHQVCTIYFSIVPVLHHDFDFSATSARKFFGCFWLSVTFALKKLAISQRNKKAKPC